MALIRKMFTLHLDSIHCSVVHLHIVECGVSLTYRYYITQDTNMVMCSSHV